MKKILIIIIALLALTLSVFAADIIPVDAWPKSIGGYIFNPTVEQCVKAGYRLKQPLPDTPEGKRVVKIEWAQGDKAEQCKAVVTYEDIPVPVVKPVVGTVTVATDRVKFIFATNGTFRGTVWLDAPATNK